MEINKAYPYSPEVKGFRNAKSPVCKSGICPSFKTDLFDSSQTLNACRVLRALCALNISNNNPVAFKGKNLKKSDFSGIDLSMIERYKFNIQQFQSKDDLQKCCKKEIEKLRLKQYPGRQEDTNAHREAALKEWFDYVIDRNEAYSDSQRLMILNSVTKDLKLNNDNVPPILDKGVLAKTVTELENKLQTHPKFNFDFHKMYQNNLRQILLEDNITGETLTGWVVIPSKKNDSENFEKNVSKLKILSHKSWCTKSFNAKPYLEKGDFHVYLENGQPKLGVRFVGEKVEEIQGEKNNQRIPLPYFCEFEKYMKENNLKLNEDAMEQLRDAEFSRDMAEIIKTSLGDAIKLKDVNDATKVLNYFGCKPEVTKDDKIILPEYNGLEGIKFEDIGIDENNLFKYISEIKGNAKFFGSTVTHLGNLESIGGNVDFEGSSIKDLGKLKHIGGDVHFGYCRIGSLGNLKSIGGMADFSYSNIEDLGGLKKIGGNAVFIDSQITDLKNLEVIGGNVKFGSTFITSLGHLEEILGNADFSFSDIADLGSLKYIKGDALFNNTKLINLSNLREIGGNADFRYTALDGLGKLEKIDGRIDCDESSTIAWDYISKKIQNNEFDFDDFNNDDIDNYDDEDPWQQFEQG